MTNQLTPRHFRLSVNETLRMYNEPKTDEEGALIMESNTNADRAKEWAIEHSYQRKTGLTPTIWNGHKSEIVGSDVKWSDWSRIVNPFGRGTR